MNIGFDANKAFHNHTGLGNYSRTVIKNLSFIYPEHNYYLFTSRISDKFPSFPPSNSSVVQPSKIIDRIFSLYRGSCGMVNDIRKNKIDIFHGLSNELPQNVYKRDIKTVVTIHDLIFLRFPQYYNKIDFFYCKNKLSATAKMADRVIATSVQTKSDLISFFDTDPEKIEVIYQGCDPGFYQKVSEEIKKHIRIIYKLPENYILYVGTIEERKNLLQLIRARHEHGINMPLVAIGRQTSYMDKIKKYLHKNRITDIVFTGQVVLSDLPAIYQMATVFVYPSLFEGFGIPVLEALNSGTPVIAATGSCLEETGGLYSIYVNPDNPDEIAGALNRVLTDEELRKKMINEGYRYALNFREDKSIRKIMELYQKLI